MTKGAKTFSEEEEDEAAPLKGKDAKDVDAGSNAATPATSSPTTGAPAASGATRRAGGAGGKNQGAAASATTPSPASANAGNAPDTLAPASAQAGLRLVLEAREALRRRDNTRLATLRNTLQSQGHPLTSWVDYWELLTRLGGATVEEVEAFYTRWRGRYVEDRLRNDWLLELGRRRAWQAFANDFPRFRMNDDREVTCYALLTQHQLAKAGTPWPAASSTPATPLRVLALDAWLEQRDADDGCHQLAQALLEAKVFSQDDVWAKVRHALDMGRLRAARHAATLLPDAFTDTVAEALQSPTRVLQGGRGTTGPAAAPAKKGNIKTAAATEKPLARSPEADKARRSPHIISLALARLAQADPEEAISAMREKWSAALPPNLASWVWGQLGEQAALRHMPQALDLFKESLKQHDIAKRKSTQGTPNQASRADPVSDEVLSWAVRAALRSQDSARWTVVQRAIEAMRPATVAAEPAWTYWLARSQAQNAKAGAEGDEARKASKQALMSLSSELHFYGLLAAEELGQGFMLPKRATPVTDEERQAARDHPGLRSALLMMSIGLREEGVREWNYSLRGMDDRALIAAAAWACERQVWDRCINTSDRTRTMIDLSQRYPTPFLKELTARTREVGLDLAYVYGLIRQESRFLTDARSHVGASGLMQLMPGTARWTANKMGVPYKPDLINDPALNLAIGTQYLKMVLDDFGGSQAMAAAAYNAGPSRPRRWREGATMEAAAWAESIPFNETRDYVKKVLSNAVIYSHVFSQSAEKAASASATSAGVVPLNALKNRLGTVIGPRDSSAPAPNRDLP